LLLWVATPRPAQDAQVEADAPAAAKPNGAPPRAQAPSPPAPQQ
jgi:hypothetical protein